MKYARVLRQSVFATAALIVLAACSEGAPVTENDTRRVALILDNSDGNALLLDPRTAALHVGFGMLIRAQITGPDGEPIAGARPTWRSTDESIVRLTPLPDSGFADDGQRVLVGADSVGVAFVIASFGSSADTAIITVAPRQVDSTGGVPIPSPTRFEMGLWMTTHVDTTMLTIWQYGPVANATVRLVQLPLVTGDFVPPGSQQVSEATLLATLVSDTDGYVVFHDIPMSRYRVEVQPPAPWQARNVEFGPPNVASVRDVVRLVKN